MMPGSQQILAKDTLYSYLLYHALFHPRREKGRDGEVLE